MEERDHQARVGGCYIQDYQSAQIFANLVGKTNSLLEIKKLY